ncbi:rRNA maturation RNase YbeY [Maribacter sp. MJ134]|uniref:rRNA maturation RNase YbeY n=1 Tax=Maribacter sp. MJ134 TaxID=2496865 RepID=UPI000F84BA3B|nr:rRNA maturation RNase YbeY [Maribacter sp. MJ134]AZQ59717.1 rRNA maturation RNase YbeY [Maribacter sp. MJ134]
MINFNYELDFTLKDPNKYIAWINRICDSEDTVVKELNYIFCDDDYLLAINQKYLKHDTYTDIITFDYTENEFVSGDIYISIERVAENSLTYAVSLENELLRVMAHGILHLLGFKDKGASDIAMMRKKEEEKINLFHVEQR